MHPRSFQVYKSFLIAASAAVLGLSVGLARADDTGFLGRLFRLGGGSSQPGSNSSGANQSSPLPSGRGAGASTNSGNSAAWLIGLIVSIADFWRSAPGTRDDPSDGCRGTGTKTFAETPRQSGGHERRSNLDANGPGPLQRWQPVRHVLPSFCRRNGHRLRRCTPSAGRRSQADRGTGSIRRPVPAAGTLRGACHRLHRVRSRRDLRAAIWTADCAFVLVFRKYTELRPIGPSASHHPGEPSIEAQPPSAGNSAGYGSIVCTRSLEFVTHKGARGKSWPRRPTFSVWFIEQTADSARRQSRRSVSGDPADSNRSVAVDWKTTQARTTMGESLLIRDQAGEASAAGGWCGDLNRGGSAARSTGSCGSFRVAGREIPRVSRDPRREANPAPARARPPYFQYPQTF